MDFYQICTRETKGVMELYPDFTVGRSSDLMVRGKSFYAVWNEKTGLWSTDEYDVQTLIDEELREFDAKSEIPYNVKYLRSASNGGWYAFQKFLKNVSDNSKQLDDKLTFANTIVKKSDYVSRRLPYNLEPGDFSAWDELVGTLYNLEERKKIEWIIGAIVAGDAKKIHKFGVFYGPPGSGKSTILNIIQRMFEGYVTTFDAKALGSSGASFATEVFKSNPLVAIQHDGDLSKIEDNARLNSIVSHEDMPMNEKYKPGYTAKVNAMLLMGTNQPVKISDAKSGLIRRLIDIHPTGVKIPVNHYHTLMSRIEFELGAIAHHCLEDVYRKLGKNHFNNYRPLEMMLQTDVFFNFIEASFDIFKSQDGTTLKQAYTLYKEYCAETGIDRVLPMYKVREELRNYFETFHDRYTLDDANVRSYYQGFNANKFKTPAKEPNTFALVMEETESLLDLVLSDQPAQTFRIDEFGNEVPSKKWASVHTTLSEINTGELHYVKIPENHIVIDFDLKDPETGEKSLERNLEAASVWPQTYAELSKGGNGVHLHYTYNGDQTQLSSVYSEGIEVKTLLGDASLRRRLSYCNNVPVAALNVVLPLKERKVFNERTIKTEQGLRNLIDRNLRKEIHPGTKPSVDFIKKILDDAYDSGITYDVTDLRPVIMSFAMSSTHQALQALKVVNEIKWSGGDPESNFEDVKTPGLAFGASAATQTAAKDKDERLVFWDVEVYPNLFVVCWKFQGSKNVVTLRNPTSADVEELMKLKLVGFNNRRYYNHLLYGRFMGMSNKQLFILSQKIINNDRNCMFVEAYGISYADIFDFSSKKQSLKRFMIDLGIHRIEMDIPWDEDVPDDLIEKVEKYCANDVIATEATFEDRKADFTARQILAELSGLTVNDTTAKHTARIIFGSDRNPQAKFKYTDLSKMFEGYEFDFGKSKYRGEDPSEGGYVYAETGIYNDVAVLDVESMHPTSLIQMNYFGEYTGKYADLLKARLAIKHGDFELARKMLDGRLKPYLEDESGADDLSYALKIVINIVYGMTSAKFDNPFRMIQNKDNIVAKRGALFMIDLKHYVQEQGFTVAHIKTDSIKIPNATPEIIAAVSEFGKKYGYTFEHEATYSKMCLVNDAVYIAKVGWANKESKINKWVAVGAQFQHPYVYKTLFTKEEPVFPDDFYEAKQVMKGVMVLDFDSVQSPNKPHGGVQFVGRTGLFLPVTPESGGGILYRQVDDKKFAVVGTKGFVWLESEMAKTMGEDVQVDMSYFEGLATKAVNAINQFGDFQEFLA